MIFWSKKKQKEPRRKKPKKQIPEKVVYRPEKHEEVDRAFAFVPRVVFIGSYKGGVGKSFISTYMTVYSVLSSKVPFAVDLDIDARTLSEHFLFGIENTIKQKIMKAGKVDYATFVDVVKMTFDGVKGKYGLLKLPLTVLACDGQEKKGHVRLLPSFSVTRKHELQRLIESIDVTLLTRGIEDVIEYIKDKSMQSKGELFGLLDGKQKSSLGISLEPMYSVAMELADVVVLVVDASEVQTTKLAPYLRHREKLFIVINRATPSHSTKLALLTSELNKKGIKYLIIPELPRTDPAVGMYIKGTYNTQFNSSRLTPYMVALLYMLNLIDVEDISRFGCKKALDIVKYHQKLWR